MELIYFAVLHISRSAAEYFPEVLSRCRHNVYLYAKCFHCRNTPLFYIYHLEVAYANCTILYSKRNKNNI